MPGFEPTAETIAKYRHAKLDSMLALAEPHRTIALRSWLEAAQLEDDPSVKIVALDADGGRYNKVFACNRRGGDGKPMTVSAAGRRVSRQIAIELLLMHGEKGQYRGVHIPTGLTIDSWETLQEEYPQRAASITRRNGGKPPEFINTYLTHQTEAEAEAEAEAKAAAKAAA